MAQRAAITRPCRAAPPRRGAARPVLTRGRGRGARASLRIRGDEGRRDVGRVLHKVGVDPEHIVVLGGDVGLPRAPAVGHHRRHEGNVRGLGRFQSKVRGGQTTSWIIMFRIRDTFDSGRLSECSDGTCACLHQPRPAAQRRNPGSWFTVLSNTKTVMLSVGFPFTNASRQASAFFTMLG